MQQIKTYIIDNSKRPSFVLPPIHLNKIYHIIDGQHRLRIKSIARNPMFPNVNIDILMEELCREMPYGESRIIQN